VFDAWTNEDVLRDWWSAMATMSPGKIDVDPPRGRPVPDGDGRGRRRAAYRGRRVPRAPAAGARRLHVELGGQRGGDERQCEHARRGRLHERRRRHARDAHPHGLRQRRGRPDARARLERDARAARAHLG
jgi:hypothetical protein